MRRVPLSTGNFHGTSPNAAVIDITGQAVGGTTDVTTSIFVRNYNNSNLRLLIGFVAFDATPTYRYFLSVIDTAIPTTLNIPSGIGWSNGSTKVENYGNGWYRYTLSGRYNKVAGFNTISFVGEQIHSSTGQQFWFGDDVSGIYTWGKQIELGLFSTSYIPTAGSTVTRTADNASITGSNFTEWYNPSEGTVYCAFKLNSTATARVFNIDDGTNTNRISGLVGSSFYQTFINPAAAGPTASFSNIFDFKIASGHQDNNIQVYVNSIYQNSNTSITIPKNLNTFRIGNWHNGTFQGTTISQLTYYPTRLTNAQLQNLTK